MPVVLLVLALLAKQDPLTDARKLLEANRIEEALEPLRSALAASPDAPEALWMIALANLRLGRYDEGLPFAESSVPRRLGPDARLVAPRRVPRGTARRGSGDRDLPLDPAAGAAKPRSALAGSAGLR